MARAIRKPPSVSDVNDFRARESFDGELEQFLRLVGSSTVDVPAVSAGGIQTFDVTVPGCRANVGQTVQIGLPSAFSTSLVPWGFVSADNTVTVVLFNPTGGSINPASATYSVRVMP